LASKAAEQANSVIRLNLRQIYRGALLRLKQPTAYIHTCYTMHA